MGRRCDRIQVVYDYWGVSLKELRDAFKHVAKCAIPDGATGYYLRDFWVDPDPEHLTHIQVRYIGHPFIIARDRFEEANETVHRFLSNQKLISHTLCRDSSNIFDD